MSKKFQIAIGFLVIALVTLACGSSANVKVSTPTENMNIEQSTSVAVATPQDTEQPKATATAEVGTTRSNPAPAGSEVVVDDMAFTILKTIRPADKIVSAGNMFNSTPEADQEYVFVEVQIICKKSTDEKCSYDPSFSTKLIGSKGIEHDSEIFLSGVKDLLSGTNFYGGATISGYIPFVVGKEETNLVLVYDPILGNEFYLAIPEPTAK